MTAEQKAAFIIAQAACAAAEIAGMMAENQQRGVIGASMAYDAAAFMSVPDRYGIGHNTVVTFFHE